MEINKIIEKYLCPGCVNGCDSSCYEKSSYSHSCKKHCAGTMSFSTGTILLGMPTGFCRYGENKIDICVFESWREQPKGQYGYEKYNIPCWMHFDGECTLVRGLSPRVNRSFIDIFNGDVREKINCLEITERDMEEMD